MTTSDASALKQTRFQSIRAEAHPFCLVCGQSNPLGLGVKFTCEEDGTVSATFLGHPALEGFQGFLHGGVVASLLEGAMTNCLFARGCVAVTMDLNVRYLKPVVIGEEMVIRARVTSATPGLYLLEAELRQAGCLKAAATAKFMERP